MSQTPTSASGRRAGPGWQAVLLLAVLGLAAGWVAKAPCLATYTTADGVVALDWREGRQYRTLCYSDTIPLYGVERLRDGAFPYRTAWRDDGGTRDRYMEYPVLTGMLQYAAMRVAKAVVSVTGDPVRAGPPEVVVYFTVMAALLALAWLVTVGATAPMIRRRRWSIALVALSPVVVVHLLTNFDPLAVALASGGLLAWSRRRPGLAGLLLGLGGAAKLYPLFLLGPLLVLGLRTGRLGPWLRCAAAAGAAWLVVNLPIAVLYPRGWSEFLRLSSRRPADHDSIYFALEFFTSWSGFDGPLSPDESPVILNTVTLVLFAAVCAGVAVLALTAPRRPRVAALAFLVVAGFLLTSKVWSPQFSLWLVPLAVLALPRWGVLLPWMVSEAVLWWARMTYFLEGDRAVTGRFLGIVLLRDALVIGICALVVRDVYRPDRDLVRAEGDDDPCGGPYEDAPDEVHRLRLRTGLPRNERPDLQATVPAAGMLRGPSGNITPGPPAPRWRRSRRGRSSPTRDAPGRSAG